jgi:anti-sigma factor ChrR (cupin superfamily)
MFDLEAIAWKRTRHQGIALFFYAPATPTTDGVVLIRMEPGCHYPAHKHVGIEDVLVLQGQFTDERGTHRAGEFVRYEAGSVHKPEVPEGSGVCVLFAIAREGILLQE